MAEDDSRIQFYLTDKGWRISTRKFYNVIQGVKRIRPRSAIATFELSIYQRSGFSPEERSWNEKWRKAGITNLAINKFIREFGRPDENSTI
ncbi:MAG: hypothetical protein IPK50_06455 [Fibrobacterota bacterium]|nr:MAG: hypothetical protein IPK50_06455 [Fibrobacterota bacterium]